jgi:two-component system sensor histidine kinase AlgZ
MCLAFVLVAPVSWRILFPAGLDLRHGGVRLLLYTAVGTAVVLVLGAVVPIVLEMGPTLLTDRAGMVVCLALFLVGGWGLGRDIDRDDRLRDAEARAADLYRAAERAELLALRTHLDPHFLFNTLGAIAEWCRQDGEVAERAVLQLADMLRSILAGVRAPSWPLARELELANTLMELYRFRDPLPTTSVPPMLLLPLIENAIKHGPAAGHRGPLVLTVSEDRSADALVISLENPGPFAGRRAGGEGLGMVERRLALAYGAEARLTIGTVGDRTVTEAIVPLAGPHPGGTA